MTTTLIVPGLKSSGPAHWQSWFEQHIPGTVRVNQRDWSHANLADWSSRVRREISTTYGRILVVAHSFGALAAVQAAADHQDRIAGALLVAPADPDKFGVSEYLPSAPLPFPSVVVASTNDPWISIDRAAYWAGRWGSDLVNLGAAGHINVEFGFGPWPEGLSLLQRLRRASEFRSAHSVNRSISARAFPRRHDGIGKLARATLQSSLIDERQDVRRAAALLEDAGWQVVPPHKEARVARA